MSAPLDLQPAGLGSLLSRSFTLYIRTLPFMALVFLLVVSIPAAAASNIVYHLSTPNAREDATLSLVAWCVRWSLMVLACAGSAYFLARYYLSGSLDLKRGASLSLRFLPNTVVSSLCASLIIVGPVLVLVGLMMMLKVKNGASVQSLWFVIAGVVMLAPFLASMFLTGAMCTSLEGRGPFDALARGRHLSAHGRGRCFSMLLMTELILLVLAGILSGVVEAAMEGLPGLKSLSSQEKYPIAVFIEYSVMALFYPLIAATMVVFYFDQRCRREGYDIALLASALGLEPERISLARHAWPGASADAGAKLPHTGHGGLR